MGKRKLQSAARSTENVEPIVAEAMRRLQSGEHIPRRSLNPIERGISERFKEILDLVGLKKMPSTEDTPDRYARFLINFCRKPFFNFTLFDSEGSSEMVVVNDIPVASLCEHHTLPFIGTATVAYIPNKKIVGLSKLPRLVEFFARGFQNQERLTSQIGEFLRHSDLKPLAVGVSIECVHTCMSIRGAKAHGAKTTTTYVAGYIKTNAACKAEFLQRIKHS